MVVDLTSLTSKQQKFVHAYLETQNATASAIIAGYAEGSASVCGMKLKRHPVIAQAIKEQRDAIAKEAGVTIEYVIQGLKKEAEREGPGASHNARVSSYGLLARHLGMLRDKVEHSGPEGEPVQFILPGQQMFDNQLDDEDDDEE